jgi:hypothetical protein
MANFLVFKNPTNQSKDTKILLSDWSIFKKPKNRSLFDATLYFKRPMLDIVVS